MTKFKFNLTKRQKFFLTSLFLGVGLLTVRLSFFSHIPWRFRLVAFAIATIGATVVALKDEDFSGVEWITLIILPVLLALSGALVYPLLPGEIGQVFFWVLDTDTAIFLSGIVKFIYLILFGIGIYAVLLTENIFNIAGVKTIQLTRVGHSVGFFLTLVCSLLLNLVIYSFHLSSFWIFVLVFGTTFLLSLQSIWSFTLEPKISKEVVVFSISTALCVAQIAWILAFWPITNFIFALFLTALLYELIGVIQAHLTGRLTKNLILESVFVMTIFLFLTIFSATWGK